MDKVLNKILVFCIFFVSIYHILIWLNNEGVFNFTEDHLKNYIYAFFHIPISVLIITLIIKVSNLFLFFNRLYFFIPYFVIRILYRVCLFFEGPRVFVRSIDIDFWLFLLVGLSILGLLALRFINNND